MKIILKIVKSFIRYLHQLFHLNNNKKYISAENIDLIDYEKKLKDIYIIEIDDKRKFKWVGAVSHNEYVYFIPNSINSFFKINIYTDNYEYINFEEKEKKGFKWSGGCLYNNMIYCFPRSSNYLLQLNPLNNKVKYIDLKLHYNKEHHYGGVMTKEGIIYQPPRNNNTLLVINLNNNNSREIKLCPSFIKLNYISGKLHPNGLIYFLPVKNERVLVFNPKTEKFWFIGAILDSNVYDVALAPNGCMYGFSGYSKGILKIDPYKNKTKMICKNIGIAGAFGTKLGANGLLYSVPGSGNTIYEFDSKKEKVKRIYQISDNDDISCAGGTITKNGKIYFAPENKNKIYVLSFENIKSEKLCTDEFPFVDFY